MRIGISDDQIRLELIDNYSARLVPTVILAVVRLVVPHIYAEVPDKFAFPDEILLSSDKTVTIIDGSGVAHDPAGLDRNELIRLAKARQMVNNFDKSKLSSQGYVILVEEKDRTLPSSSLPLIKIALHS